MVWFALCMGVFLLSGCTMVGPQSISSGRLNYAEAIDATENQQMLLAIVKGRYAETSSLLAVTGVAANIRFRVDAGVEGGFEATGIPGDDLLTASVAYEENPTITYTPVQSERYVQQLLSPLPLDILIRSLRSVTNKRHLFTLLVSQVNALRNPDFLETPSGEADSRFIRFIELFSELHRADIVDIFRSAEMENGFEVLISDYLPQYYPAVVELLDMLDLPVPEDLERDIVIPIHFGVLRDNSWGLGITTRSTFDLVEIMRAAIVVPEEHLQAGLTIEYPPIGLPGKGIRIKSSKSKPEGNSSAIYYKGYWFFISATDLTTKATFNMLRTMWSITIASSTDESQAPVLTIPVGR